MGQGVCIGERRKSRDALLGGKEHLRYVLMSMPCHGGKSGRKGAFQVLFRDGWSGKHEIKKLCFLY